MLTRVLAVVVVVVVGVAVADPWRPHYPSKYRSAPYEFAYGVQDSYSGQNFGQSESSDGKTVVGGYSVDLPDGRTQTVQYRADPYSGFQADVKFSGRPYHPPTRRYKTHKHY